MFNRCDWKAGAQISGPALIVEPQTTTFVSADFSASVDGFGNIFLEKVEL